MSSCFLTNFLSARVTLGVMAFLMFSVTQMIRTNIYIVVVAMSEKVSTNGTDQFTGVPSWNDNKFSLFMGAFYWSYWMTELPGGILAQAFGGKKVIGIGVASAALLNFLLPIACHHHYLAATFLRVLQGLSLGVTWPVMHWLSARWIPQTERSKFMTSYHGASIGNAITYPLSGIIITHYEWEVAFYFVGIVTLIWCFAWWILVYDSPDQHPRLTEKESKYLKEALSNSVKLTKTAKTSTPWIKILHSKSFWAVLIASQGLMWGTITLSMQTPTYFHDVHKLDIKATGLLSGIPEISKFFFSLLFSSIIDLVISKKILSVTSARKLSVIVSELIPAGLLFLLGFYGFSDKVLATVLLTGICLVGGASASGSLANIVDLSPNHAGTLLGIIKTLTIIPGVISPILVNYLTSDLAVDKAAQWKNVFIFVAIIYILCSSIYSVFGSGDLQPWNEDEIMCKKEEGGENMEEEVVFLESKEEVEKNSKNKKGREMILS